MTLLWLPVLLNGTWPTPASDRTQPRSDGDYRAALPTASTARPHNGSCARAGLCTAALETLPIP